jgi:hypothetical protein
MGRKQLPDILMGFGLGALLTVGVGACGVASVAPQAQGQSYTGQVREIKIDQCGLKPGTCAGALVLVQASGQQVALVIPAGTTIQRGGQRVHLEELGVGNHVRVQAASRSPSPPGHSKHWTWEKVDTQFKPPLKGN